MSALRNTFGRTTIQAGAILAALPLAFTFAQPAVANDAPTQPAAVSGPIDGCAYNSISRQTPLGQARCFSMENDVIGFAVIGRATNATNDQVVDHIQNKFLAENISARPFSMMPNRDGLTIVFFLRGSQYGPNNWENRFATVVAHAREKGSAQLASAPENTFAMK